MPRPMGEAGVNHRRGARDRLRGEARELPYRLGLPKKAFNTSGKVAEILGVTSTVSAT